MSCRDTSLLSVELESYIDSLDRQEEPPDPSLNQEEKPLGPEERRMLQKLVRTAARSLEGFAEPWAKKLIELWQDDRETWESIVDDHYTREVVGGLQGIVARFLRLSPVLVGVVPSKEVSLYLREATRCYLYGFFEASIALSRAALEAGLNEHFKRRLGKAPSQQLVEKVKAANKWKLLTGQSAGMAEDVAKAAGMVLHQQPAKSQKLSFDTLVRVRGVLRELFQC